MDVSESIIEKRGMFLNKKRGFSDIYDDNSVSIITVYLVDDGVLCVPIPLIFLSGFLILARCCLRFGDDAASLFYSLFQHLSDLLW